MRWKTFSSEPLLPFSFTGRMQDFHWLNVSIMKFICTVLGETGFLNTCNFQVVKARRQIALVRADYRILKRVYGSDRNTVVLI